MSQSKEVRLVVLPVIILIVLIITHGNLYTQIMMCSGILFDQSHLLQTDVVDQDHYQDQGEGVALGT